MFFRLTLGLCSDMTKYGYPLDASFYASTARKLSSFSLLHSLGQIDELRN